jgi:hypothetical protein
MSKHFKNNSFVIFALIKSKIATLLVVVTYIVKIVFIKQLIVIIDAHFVM